MSKLPIAGPRTLRLLYSSILNFEILAAVLLWSSHRGLAWWMIVSAFTTLVGFLIPLKDGEA